MSQKTSHARSHLSSVLILAAVLVFTACSPTAQNKKPNPLGSFDFDFERLGETPAEQIAAMKTIGFSGATLRFNTKAQKDSFSLYRDAAADQDFSIYAVHFGVKIKQDNSQNLSRIEALLEALQSAGSSLWLILNAEDELERSTILSFISEVADRASAKSVPFILYPHYSNLIESAEEALPYLEELGRDDIFVSVHLCHEIRAGNGDRIEEVVEKVGDRLRLPSISGADKEFEPITRGDWTRTIQPLYQGDYDASRMIRALRKFAYQGPVILHTFGLQDEDADHHERSFDFYRGLFGKP